MYMGVMIILAIWKKMKKSKKKGCTYNNKTLVLFLANRLLNINGINDYVISISCIIIKEMALSLTGPESLNDTN